MNPDDPNRNETKARKTVDGKDTYKIEIPGETVSASMFYDVTTGLKVKEISSIKMGGQTQTQESTFSDYKDYEGIKFASKKKAPLGPQKVESTLKEVLINKGVSEEDFK